MTKRNTSITINGKQYDAVTGAVVGRRSIDGVIGKKSDLQSVASVATADIRQPKQRAIEGVTRTTAHHTHAHHAGSSKTLMRTAVHKPTYVSLKRQVKVQTSTLAHADTAVHVVVHPKTSVYQVHPTRQARAAQVGLSPQVSHFAHEVRLAAPKVATEVAHVLETPVTLPESALAYRQPESATAQAERQKVDIFEQALARATSHQEPAPAIKNRSARRRAAKIVRHRMTTYTAGAVFLLFAISLFGFQNADNFKFKSAASQAGFAATMPGYAPAGFSLTELHTTPGSLIADFEAPTNNADGGPRSYALTEQPSTLNSQALLTTIATSSPNSAFNTIESAGRTVYVYGQNQAAWVHNGILYQVIGHGVLTTQEFGKIAASM